MSQILFPTILVAPLDWGLGHATRCIPLIKHLLQLNCKVLIAAEGKIENLLKNEFPHVEFIRLKGYHIQYSVNKRLFPLKIIGQVPKILKAISQEHKLLEQLIKKQTIHAVISDNRYGLFNPAIPSVFITHQLQIKTGLKGLDFLARQLNYRFLKHFSTCWVPDFEGTPNIAGSLSHPKQLPAIPVKYLGSLSRLNAIEVKEIKFKACIILSGPEPQRSIFEEVIVAQLKVINYPILLVRGLPGSTQQLVLPDNISVKNHVTAEDLERAFAESELIISRSGYTTVMDVLKLNKKSILVPTPGQTEQEYLAKQLYKQHWAFYIQQPSFHLKTAIDTAAKFPYNFPELPMDNYQVVVAAFIKSLVARTG